MSLPQRGYSTGYNKDKDDRTPYELVRFKKGLKSINVWYAHERVTTLICDWPTPEGASSPAPIERRGWCIFEQRLSSLNRMSWCCLKMSQLPRHSGPLSWCTLAGAGGPLGLGRLAPQTPDAFKQMVQEGMENEAKKEGTGFRFTNGKDATEICIPQYQEAFLRIMAKGSKLSFDVGAWGDEEVRDLVAALQYAHAEGATSQTRELNICDNNLTDESVPLLLKLLASGTVPKLVVFRLQGNCHISERRMSEIRAAAFARGIWFNVDREFNWDNVVPNSE